MLEDLLNVHCSLLLLLFKFEQTIFYNMQYILPRKELCPEMYGRKKNLCNSRSKTNGKLHLVEDNSLKLSKLKFFGFSIMRY